VRARIRMVLMFPLMAIVAGFAAVAVTAGTAAAQTAPDVVVFSDGTYVDLATNTSGEAYNIRKTLEAQGNTVTTFTGTDQASWDTALAGQDVLVLPELQNGDLNAALSSGARAAIVAHVQNGGGLIATMDSGTAGQRMVNLLNTTFGYSLAFASFSGTTASLNTSAAAGTPYEGGPATLPRNSAVGAVNSTTLPSTAKNIYTSDSGTRAWVTFFSEGAGQIALLGWDWFNAQPTGTADGGWLDVLDRSIAQIAVPIGVSIDVSDTSVTAGSSGSYAIIVTNTGGGSATSVRVTDTGLGGVQLSAAAADQGTCTVGATQIDCALGTIASGATATVSVTFAVSGTAEAQLLTHTANALSGEGATASDTAGIAIAAAPATTTTTTTTTTIAPITTTTPPPTAVASYGGGTASITATAGSSVTVTGSGFAAETDVEVWLHSDPVLLGTVRADASGAFTATFALPATAPRGDHLVVLNGTDVNGEAISRTLAIRIQDDLAFTGSSGSVAARATVATTMILVGLAAVVIAGAKRRPLRTY
jgi:hypothetical protein